MDKKTMKFLDKRLLSFVAALGLSFPLMGQDKPAETKPETVVESEKTRKIQAILKQQFELEADGLVAQAGKNLKVGNFVKAEELYKKADLMYKKASKSEPRVMTKIAQVKIQRARALRFEADRLIKQAMSDKGGNSKEAFDNAISNLKSALTLDDTRRAEITAEIVKIKKQKDRYIHFSNVDAKNLREKFDNDQSSGDVINEIYMAKAQKLYGAKQYGEARSQVEQILLNQPYNPQAVNFLAQINRKMGETARTRRNQSYQEYLAQVEWKWSEPISRYSSRQDAVDDVRPVDTDKTLGSIYKKLQIVIPKVRFVDKDLAFVVDFIKRSTRELSSDCEGLNVFVAVDEARPNDVDAGADAEEDVDDFGDEEEFEDGDEDALDGEEATAEAAGKITIDADKMPVGELIKYICQQLNLRYKVEEHAVIIGDSGQFQTLETEFYPISAGFLEIVETKSTGGGGLDGIDGEEADGPNFQTYFSDMGITVPPGAKIKFVQSAMRLVVTNTPANHDRLKEILRQIGIETPQVSIESKFIEINHTGVEEFGFEWRVGRPGHIFNDAPFIPGSLGAAPTFITQSSPFDGQSQQEFNQILENQAAVAVGAPPPNPLVPNAPAQIQVTDVIPAVDSQNDDLASAVDPRNGIDHQPGLPGDRQYGQVPSLDSGIRGINDILLGQGVSPIQAGVRMILGDFALQGMIRALEQQSTSDVLSAPQVTAVSGQSAVIKIVEERVFPESFDAADISASFIIGTSPQFGDPMDIGIVLEVTPTVEPDGYTISMELKPQILELVGFDQAFNTVLTNAIIDPVTGNPQQIAGRPDIAPGDFPIIYEMPILTARTIETRVTVWDGESIMLGGLVRERVTAVDDKVPYVADLPLIGRLFRSKGAQNVKQNLLVFVTARLVDKAGLPKKERNTNGLPDFKRL